MGGIEIPLVHPQEGIFENQDKLYVFPQAKALFDLTQAAYQSWHPDIWIRYFPTVLSAKPSIDPGPLEFHIWQEVPDIRWALRMRPVRTF